MGREEQETAAASSLTRGEALEPRAREEVEEGRGACLLLVLLTPAAPGSEMVAGSFWRVLVDRC